jgi:hypothetical protein
VKSIFLLLVFGCLHAYGTPTNTVIDLTLPAMPPPQTDPYIFDESVIFSPNFAINQNDPALSDLFNKEGKSNLCFPTAFAEALVYLYGYHSAKFENLKIAGLIDDGKSIEPNSLIRDLAKKCKTDPEKGTQGLDAIDCVSSLFTQSGYKLGDTQLISPFSTYPLVLKREPTIEDIRNYIKKGNPLILEIAWYSYDTTKKNWIRHNGHYINVFGYDYNRSWGENQIELKVVNPELNYSNKRDSAIWDTITLEKYSSQPGITYPSDRSFILSGHGFGGTKKRAFSGMLLILDPRKN